MHDILGEKEENLPEIVTQSLIKSVINRERRKVYREIYDILMKKLQNFKLSEKLDNE